MDWITEDPRIRINKRANIIIVDLRSPVPFGGSGEVETKNAYCIWTTFENYKFISANDEWPEDFVWALAPSKETLKQKV